MTECQSPTKQIKAYTSNWKQTRTSAHDLNTDEAAYTAPSNSREAESTSRKLGSTLPSINTASFAYVPPHARKIASDTLESLNLPASNRCLLLAHLPDSITRTELASVLEVRQHVIHLTCTKEYDT